MPIMDEAVAGSELLAAWTFQRGDDRLTIRREATDDGMQLVVMENNRPRTFTFVDADRLAGFQHDMEAFLVRTGWSLAEFTPDRRRGLDRRGFPRVEVDRRRWWTDSPSRPPS
jgi:hypothetical protein